MNEYIPSSCRRMTASGNMVNVEKLEEILVAQWAAFINPVKLMAWTMETVRANLDSHFIVVSDADFSNRGTQITLSRCSLREDRPGLSLWIDFTVPYDGKTAVGTVAANLANDGSLKVVEVSGHLYSGA